MDDNSLNEEIALADPLREIQFGSAEVDHLLGRLAREVASASQAGTAGRRHRVGPRRRLGLRRSRRTLALALVLACGFAAVAGGYAMSTHTGIFGNPSFSEEDGSEYLRTDAPGFRAAARDSIPIGVPSPPGGWSPLVDEVVEQGRVEPSLMQTTGVSARLAYKALCSWTGAWLGSERGADSDATRALEGAARWPVLVATDGGGTVTSLSGVGRAAHRGQAAPIAEYRRANCEVGG